LEIGTGMGSLTAKLAERAAAVVTVEVDRYLQQLAREELESFNNVRFLQLDALRNKNHISDEVIDAVQAELAVDPSRRFKVAANLPFGIATPVLSNLLTTPVVPIAFTVTIQKDLAERIVARPSTKDYSALSIWIQSLCEVELIRLLPSSVFWPRPKVESAIIQVRPSVDKRTRVGDLDFFHRLVRSVFCHRRKLLRTALLGALSDQLDKAAIDRLLTEQQFPPDARAEQLTVDQFVGLAHAVRSRIAIDK
jgi:16S rRNA (adenine1518-N6/adenine1519-N6)-dimethyltransferase